MINAYKKKELTLGNSL